MVHGTNHIKGYALANEIKSVDYATRNMDHAETGLAETLARIRAIVIAIAGGDALRRSRLNGAARDAIVRASQPATHPQGGSPP
jgi:hypothetical protein